MSSLLGMNEITANPKNLKGQSMQSVQDRYDTLFSENGTQSDNSQKQKERKSNYSFIVDTYYNLVTSFYEYGWGQSFHFAPRFKGETFRESLWRHEMYLALRLGLKPGMRSLDMGCGVGGPLRTIARFSGSHVTGITINEYQVGRARMHNKTENLEKLTEIVQGNFMALPFPDNSFDAVYAIEATCHAPNKEICYGNAYRVLKPGSVFAFYEWVMTDKYDPEDAYHRKIKLAVEKGDGLPNLDSQDDVLKACKKVGFEILEHADLALEEKINNVPWYEPLDGKMTLSGFKHTRVGRALTKHMLTVMETARLAPKGSSDVAQLLNDAADALVEGGKTGIFTPMYFVLCRKPLNA